MFLFLYSFAGIFFATAVVGNRTGHGGHASSNIARPPPQEEQ